MVALRVCDPFQVTSHRGPYAVRYETGLPFASLATLDPRRHHLIVDTKVARLYGSELAFGFAHFSALQVEATEDAKSLDQFSGYVEHLLAHGIRRDHALVAVGGGIIQDITCFLAAVLMRGVAWSFHPTTLLAQADSCIGSKSSINVGRVKNVLGTFTPPTDIAINVGVLATLELHDTRSGVGEMLKVHAIEGPTSFDRIAADYDRLFADEAVMARYIHQSLKIKQGIIEADEFDRGSRNVMNYGHSFGHAIESATEFAVPHGIAVTIGMDMANYVAARAGLAPLAHFARMHDTLARNAQDFAQTPVPLEAFLSAIGKDKKNTNDMLNLVLPGSDGRIGRMALPKDEAFRSACADYLSHQRTP